MCTGAEDIWTRTARGCAVLAFAFLCEWLELAVYGNLHFEWHDVRIDWIGVGLGFVISVMQYRISKRKQTAEKMQDQSASV